MWRKVRRRGKRAIRRFGKRRNIKYTVLSGFVVLVVFSVLAANATLPSGVRAKQFAPSLPGAPTIDSIVGDASSLSVTFTGGSANGGTISMYRYSTDNGTTWQDRQDSGGGASNAPLVITTLSSDGTTALSSGVTYQVRLRAVNEVGEGAVSNGVPGELDTSGDVPDAPSAPSVEAGPEEVAVSWSAPYDGGSAIIDYTVEVYDSLGDPSPPGVTGAYTRTTSSTSLTFTGLSTSYEYKFTVTARNAIGYGPTSDLSSGVTPNALPPGQPGTPAGLPGNEEIFLYWVPPTTGDPVTEYFVGVLDANGDAFVDNTYVVGDMIRSAGANPYLLFDGLTNGIGYTFVVVAVDADSDESAPSGLSDVIIPIGGAAAGWGTNDRGNLGVGDTETEGYVYTSTEPISPNLSTGLEGKSVTDISTNGDYVSGSHTCAVADGDVYCWGSNDNGQVGIDSEATQVDFPTLVEGLLTSKTVTKISTGLDHTCAVADGEAFCWGSNLYLDYYGSGKLGDGTSTSSLVPVAVDTSGVLNGKTVTDISAGWAHTCAIADGEAFCWGLSDEGQIGASGFYSYEPVAVDTSGVLDGKTVTDISAGRFNSCVVADGEAICWGNNAFGQIGDDSYGGGPTPTAVDTSGVLSGKTVTDISIDNVTTCAVASGEAFCWGWNGYGLLGNNTLEDGALVPVAVADDFYTGQTVTTIENGNYHNCLVADGEAFCWGTGGAQLGGPSGSTVRLPKPVSTSGLLNGKTVTKVSAGYFSSAATFIQGAFDPDPPSAPTITSILPGDGQASISFTPPTSSGGIPVLTYEYSTDAGTTWLPRPTGTTASPIVVTGLENDVTYSITIRAVNGVGGGTASNAVEVTPFAISAVINLYPGPTNMKVVWEPLATETGTTTYSVAYIAAQDYGDEPTPVASCADIAVQECIIEDLDPNTDYIVYVVQMDGETVVDVGLNLSKTLLVNVLRTQTQSGASVNLLDYRTVSGAYNALFDIDVDEPVTLVTGSFVGEVQFNTIDLLTNLPDTITLTSETEEFFYGLAVGDVWLIVENLSDIFDYTMEGDPDVSFSLKDVAGLDLVLPAILGGGGDYTGHYMPTVVTLATAENDVVVGNSVLQLDLWQVLQGSNTVPDLFECGSTCVVGITSVIGEFFLQDAGFLPGQLTGHDRAALITGGYDGFFTVQEGSDMIAPPSEFESESSSGIVTLVSLQDVAIVDNVTVINQTGEFLTNSSNTAPLGTGNLAVARFTSPEPIFGIRAVPQEICDDGDPPTCETFLKVSAGEAAGDVPFAEFWLNIEDPENASGNLIIGEGRSNRTLSEFISGDFGSTAVMAIFEGDLYLAEPDLIAAPDYTGGGTILLSLLAGDGNTTPVYQISGAIFPKYDVPLVPIPVAYTDGTSLVPVLPPNENGDYASIFLLAGTPLTDQPYSSLLALLTYLEFNEFVLLPVDNDPQPSVEALSINGFSSGMPPDIASSNSSDMIPLLSAGNLLFNFTAGQVISNATSIGGITTGAITGSFYDTMLGGTTVEGPPWWPAPLGSNDIFIIHNWWAQPQTFAPPE